MSCPPRACRREGAPLDSTSGERYCEGVERLGFVAVLAAALLPACGRSNGEKPLVATADSVTSTAKTASPPAPTPVDPTKPPLFTYQEDPGAMLTYWASGALRVVVTIG